jgi:hypothetical protein
MSINYGAQSAGIPGNAGGVGFSMPLWTAGHLTPNVDLHNASIGMQKNPSPSRSVSSTSAVQTAAGSGQAAAPVTTNDPTLASRAPTNPTPGSLVSQQSTFSELPTPIRNAMESLNIPSLQAQSARAALANQITGTPTIMGGGGGGGQQFDLNDYLAKVNAQRATQAATWNANRPNYTSMLGLPTAPGAMKPAGGDLRFPQLPKY